MFEAVTRFTNQAKPVATISGPMLLSGPRTQANRPAPMKPHPTSSAATDHAPRTST